MGKAFTWYCDGHRDQVKKAPAPSTRLGGGGFYSGPSCPVCFERMYWAPNGGTVVPQPY